MKSFQLTNKFEFCYQEIKKKMECCVCYDNVFGDEKVYFDDKLLFKCQVCEEGIVCSHCDFINAFMSCPICRTDWKPLKYHQDILLDIENFLIPDLNFPIKHTMKENLLAIFKRNISRQP